MKKTYINPSLTVTHIQIQHQLLSDSNSSLSANPNKSVTGNFAKEDNDWWDDED